MAETVIFDRAADYYDQTRGFPPGVDEKVGAFVAQVGDLNPDSRVLEIGIGTGRIALPLAAHVHSIYGIDLSRPMMQRLRQKQFSELIYVAQADMRRLPFPDASFDAVIAVHVFHLVEDWENALAEVGRVLRPGAPLIHAGHIGRVRNEITKTLWRIWNEAIADDRPERIGVKEDRVETFLQESGWQPQGDSQILTYDQTFSLRQHVENAKNRVWSRMWSLSDEQIERGVAALTDYIQQTYGSLDHEMPMQGAFMAGRFYPPSRR